MILGNPFSKDIPAKASVSFANDKPAQGNAFAEDKPAAANTVFDGDNTSGGVYGGDYATFGDIYGEGVYGGLVHFKNRPDPPQINH